MESRQLRSRNRSVGRLDSLGALVDARGFVSVQDLSQRFGVSAVTIRSDLDALESVGRLRRIRGGALSRTTDPGEPPFEIARTEATSAKASIARRAAAEVHSGETVLLDVGSTTNAVASALAERSDLHDITVLTNSLTIALELESASGRIQVIVTGGTLRPLQHSLVDPMATQVLDQVTAHVAFIGCNGVHPIKGITNMNLPETTVKRAMLKATRRRIVVADGSKIGEVEVVRVCSLAEVDMLITDTSADPASLRRLRSAGLHVEMVATHG